ncbi:TfoX/Sxy family protein [Flavobacterium sp. PL002]|uniref:TfoX/Sxy family protein n=1 Tax=Flavobacterium sp. PL002 TaxID=1897058 RepID=UPI0017880194|nr:TfoX/Sxy family protein [Flavobacterium sp. PL002]MBE0392851.1 hypothetical protein [Flavobacterium sp. PL002]
MAVSKDFTQFVLDQLSGWSNVHINKMFGCVALYQDDLAFGIIANDMVYLKVDDTNKAKFIESGSVPLKPFKSNATVLSFYSIPAIILEDSEAFIRWARESLEIQKKRNK